MAQKIIRTGHSAAVTIPADFMEALNLKIGDGAVAEPDKLAGKITYHFPTVRQLPLVRSRRSLSKNCS